MFIPFNYNIHPCHDRNDVKFVHHHHKCKEQTQLITPIQQPQMPRSHLGADPNLVDDLGNLGIALQHLLQSATETLLKCPHQITLYVHMHIYMCVYDIYGVFTCVYIYVCACLYICVYIY